jgi:hypothetical protein
MISGEFNEEKIDKLIDSVLEEKSETLANLNQESIDVFKFLQYEFYKGDVSEISYLNLYFAHFIASTMPA